MHLRCICVGWSVLMGLLVAHSLLTQTLKGADETLPPGAVARLGNELLRPAIGDIVFSPDGKRLVCPPSVFDPSTGKRIHDEQFARQIEGALSLATSADGRWLAIGKSSGPINIWDRRRSLVVELLEVRTNPSKLVFSADNQFLFARTGQSDRVQVWKFVPGNSRLIFNWDGGGTMSGDGRRLACWTAHEVLCHRLDDQRIVWRKPTDLAVSAAFFSKDGKSLIVGDADGQLQWLDAATGKSAARTNAATKPAKDVATLEKEPKRAVTVVDGSADGKFVVTGHEKLLRIWNAETKTLVRSLSASGTPESLAFAPEGWRFAFRCWRQYAARLMDANTGNDVVKPQGHAGFVRSITFSGDDWLIATASYNEQRLHIWDAGNGRLVESHAALANTVRFSRDGKRLFVVEDDRLVVIDRHSGKQHIFSGVSCARSRTALGVSPDERFLVGTFVKFSDSGSFDKGSVTRVVDLDTMRVVKTFKFGGEKIEFSPDGKHMAMVVFNLGGEPRWRREAVAFDTTNWQQVLRQTEDVQAIAFSPDGRRLAIAGDEASLRIVEFPLGRTLTSRAGDLRGGLYINRLRFLSDKRLFGEPSLLIDADSGKRTVLPTKYPVTISDDGRFAWSADRDGHINQIDLTTGRVMASWNTPDLHTRHLAVSHDRKRLVSGSSRSSLLIWDVERVPDVGVAEDQEKQNAEDLKSLGQLLADRDAAAAYEAARKLAKHGADAVRWIEKHVRAADLPDAEKYLVELSDPVEYVRGRAEYELRVAGRTAAKALRDAAPKVSPKTGRSFKELADSISGPVILSPAELQLHRAAWVLEQINSPAAQRVLRTVRRPALTDRADQEAATGNRVIAKFGSSAMQPHGSAMLVKLSPDGKVLATGGGLRLKDYGLYGAKLDKRLIIKLYDVATTRLKHELVGHWSPPQALAFSDDGEIFSVC